MSGKLLHVFAPAPVTERGKSTHIGGDPKNGKKIVYTCQKTVLIRETQNHINTFQYNEHKANATCARLSPSGFYCASADESGKILVWDTVGEDHVIKLEKATIGAIADMAWSQDSQRIVVGGQGRERFGEAFLSDSGASVGEITGHSKPINSIDFKQARPFRVATGSEDMKTGWFPGPPFKYEKAHSDHTRYVNCVRFSPDGNFLLTVGSDKKGFFYDGKTGDKLAVELNGHGGGIYGCAWSSDSKRVLTASGDKTCKIWNAANGECLTTFTFGNDVNDQQVGCLWQGGDLISINLRGDLIFLDEANPDKPKKVIHGHNKSIFSLAYDPITKKVFSGDSTGYLIEWDPTNANTALFSGAAHASKITGAVCTGGKLVTVSVDDTVKISDIGSRAYGEGQALGSQPQSVAAAASQDLIVVGTVDSLVTLKGGKIVSKVPIDYNAISVAVRSDATEVAVGGSDNKVHVYTQDGGKLSAKHVLEGHRGQVNTVQYSPDNTYIASGDSNREIRVWKGTQSVVSGWVFHNSKVESISWAPDSTHLASGSVDCQIIIWNVASPNTRITIPQAHAGGVTRVVFTSANTIISAGPDCALKVWSVTY